MTRQSERVPPDPYRKARFREIARGIVAKDRYNRKYGIAVDTAGGIANALERAYRDGVHDARTGLRAGLTQDLFAAGEDAGPVLADLREQLRDAGFHKVDYADLRDAETLVELARHDVGRPARLLVAAHIGKARLLDNMAVEPVLTA